MNKEKIEYYAHLTLTLIGIALAAFVFFRYLFVPLLPFLIAWSTAFALRPLVRKISSKTGISRKAVGTTLAIITVTVGLAAIVSLAVLLLGEAWQLLSDLVTDERIYEILKKIANPIGSLFGEGEAAAELEGYLGETVKNAVNALAGGIVDVLTSIVRGIPSVLFFILITVIASIYFSLDLDNINARVRSFLPERVGNALSRLKDSFLSVGIKYIRSYLLLMLITFAVMLVGFLILRVENALLIAAVVSLLDILPLIGVGTVIVPWSVFAFLFGSAGQGIGLLVLLAVHEIIRQLAEPKIIGKSLGFHPIISLLLLYVGYATLGFAGLLLVPLVSVLINVLVNKNNTSEVGEDTTRE